MEKTELLYGLLEMLRDVHPQEWREIHLSTINFQKDFVLTLGSFTYKVKHRNIHNDKFHYLDINNTTPYTIEVEEEGNSKRPIISFNDEIKYRNENGGEFMVNHIEELFLYIENSKKAFENGALSRLEREVFK